MNSVKHLPPRPLPPRFSGDTHPLIAEQSERLMREVRTLLRYANDVAPIDRETAQSFVARAGNKLQRAIGLQK